MEGRIGEMKKERREGRKGTGKEWDIASALNALFPGTVPAAMSFPWRK